ncbi:MAG: hypothetical protein AABX34_02975 [Nanoarchaeota archaeon]
MFNKFEDVVRQPTYKHKIKIYSDGNDDYTTVLPEYYHKDCLCYGQKIKTKDGKKIFPAIKKAIFGTPELWDINTNNVECFNTILRDRLSRLVRKSQCHAKNKYALEDALYVFQFYWNFMHQVHKKQTPAILEKQATKIWTWGSFIHAKLRYFN